MPDREKGTQRLRRANTDGKVQASKPVTRATVAAEREPFDPWASDTEDDSEIPVITANPVRRKPPIPKSTKTSGTAGTGLELPSGRPNPLLANQNSRKTQPPEKRLEDSSTPETNASLPGDRASPWGSRSPSRPNPLLPSSRSPSVSRQVTDASMTPRGARDRSRKRTDGSPRTPETTDPAVYLQSLLQETPTTATEPSPPPSPPSPSCARTEMRHKVAARSLSRLYAEEEPKASIPPSSRATQMPQQESQAKKRSEEKTRGRSQPIRRTESKAEAAGAGLPVGSGKARKTTTSRPCKAAPKADAAPKERPKPKLMEQSQESPEEDVINIKIDQEVDLGSSGRTNELMTTFGDDLSFTSESPLPKVETEHRTLEVPNGPNSDQRANFGQKVYSFGLQDELDICHKLDRGWSQSSALQAAAPAAPAPLNPYDFQKPLKGKATLDGVMSKDGHASRTPNTHVRFPRLTELLRSGKALAVRPVVPEYGKMIGIMEAQMVLGHSWTAEVTATSKALGLLQWFLPYVLTISALLVLAVAALQPSEAFWVPLLLPLLLPLQQLRCRIWNRQLLQAVDKAAFADAFDQLRAPLGWGEDGQYFSANLVSAMQALDVQPGELLTSMRSRLEWKLYICCTLVFVAPAVMFIKIDGMEAAQVPVLLLCALSLLAACTPGKEMHRSELVDRRLEALEAAFNALLDTLRPLLGPSAQPTCAAQGKVEAQSSSQERFGVRMITSERLTLRGTLTILQDDCGLRVSCPLGSFELVASGLEGAVQAELGRSAAGEVDGMILLPPRAQGDSWASFMRKLLGNQKSSEPRARRDDDLASVSTASTLTRGKNQVDEASLHLALAMLKAMNRHHCEPLEVFFAQRDLFLAPPKAPYDEPSIVLALAEDQLTCYASFGKESSAASRCFRRSARITEDHFGVVRDPSEMRQLCTDEEQGPVGRVSSAHLDESPRSYAASQGSYSEDEGISSKGKWPSSTRSGGGYSKLFSAAPQHLALVFDTLVARDRCLELIRETLPLPVGRTKCFPAEP